MLWCGAVECHKVPPFKFRHELRASVGCDVCWETVGGYPAANESPRTDDCVCVRNWYGLWVPGVLSTMVNRWRNPCDDGNGPTMSMMMCSNLCQETMNVSGAGLVCLWVLAFWQSIHWFTHVATSFFMLWHTNLAKTRCCVVLTPRYNNTWTARFFHLLGTTGRCLPMETSHGRFLPLLPTGMALNARLVIVVGKAATSRSCS